MSDATAGTHHPAQQRLRAVAERLAARVGESLRSAGPVEIDAVSVRRFREAIGLDPDPRLGVPPAMLAHIFRPDVDLSADVRPRETIDSQLINPVNGGTDLLLHRRLALGDRLRCETRLHEVSVREGRSGPLVFVTTESVYVDAASAELGRIRHAMIYRGMAS